MKIVNLKYLAVAVALIIGTMNVMTAQNIHFTYDDAGNRIKKETVTISDVKKSDKEVRRFHSAEVLEADVRMEVDQSGDIIHVQIMDTPSIGEYKVGIYNLAGYAAFEASFSEPAFDVKIGDLPKGVYVIRILNGDKSKIWKIIKE